jgi:hypothetical protein
MKGRNFLRRSESQEDQYLPIHSHRLSTHRTLEVGDNPKMDVKSINKLTIVRNKNNAGS